VFGVLVFVFDVLFLFWNFFLFFSSYLAIFFFLREGGVLSNFVCIDTFYRNFQPKKIVYFI